VQITIVQLQTFVSDWRRLGLSDEDLQALEQLLMRRPDAGAVIAGTGGFRKIRFAPPSWHSGKSGAARVIYAHFPQIQAVILFLIYGKNEQGTLSAKQKQAASKWITSFRRTLAERLRHDEDPKK
jgi:hypothetical protein